MEIDEFNHKSIGELQGGGIAHAINNAIAGALRDCANRPGLNKKRRVIIQVEFLPGSTGLEDTVGLGLSSVGIEAAVDFKLPPRRGTQEFLGIRSRENAQGERTIIATFTNSTPLFPESN